MSSYKYCIGKANHQIQKAQYPISTQKTFSPLSFFFNRKSHKSNERRNVGGKKKENLKSSICFCVVTLLTSIPTLALWFLFFVVVFFRLGRSIFFFYSLSLSSLSLYLTMFFLFGAEKAMLLWVFDILLRTRMIYSISFFLLLYIHYITILYGASVYRMRHDLLDVSPSLLTLNSISYTLYILSLNIFIAHNNITSMLIFAGSRLNTLRLPFDEIRHFFSPRNKQPFRFTLLLLSL